MKQVWILNHYAQEPGGAGGTRHFHLAENLIKSGWQATLIAASVDSNSGIQRLNSKEKFRYESIAGIPFLWVRTPEYSGNGAGRMFNMLTYTLRVLLKSTTSQLQRPDVIIGSSVHPFAAAAGAMLARRFKVPFVFEVRDLWPQTLVDMGRLREGALITRLLRKLEEWLYNRAARIVVLLPNAYEYIARFGIPRDHVVWIPNGVDLSLFSDFSTKATQSSDTFTLMYFGAHGQANGLDNILLAMKLLQDRADTKHVKLRLIGDGPLKNTLMMQAKQIGLSNVCFEPPVPKRQIPTLASQADAFVISVLDLPELYRYGISMNKLFDYLAAARPIIIASNAANNPVEEAQAGISVVAGSSEELADAIQEVALMPFEMRVRMGHSGREYVEENHSFSQLSLRLASVLDDVCK